MTAPDPARLHQSIRQLEGDGGQARVVGDVTPTDHEMGMGRSWAWSTVKPPATLRELGDLITKALAHERERQAFLAESRREAQREAVMRWLYRKTGLNEDDLPAHADDLLETLTEATR